MIQTTATDNPTRCPAIKKSGELCTAKAGADGYCIGHSPDAVEARRKGGYNSSKAAKAAKFLPARMIPIANLLENALKEVHQGQLDPRQAQSMASLATALVKVITAGEIEERLRAVESRAQKDSSP